MAIAAVAPAPSNTDTPAFDALYRQHASDLFAFVMTLLRDRTAAEDVTMAAFEKAYRRRSTFDRRRGNERAWLFGIARNAALDELRRRRRDVSLVTEPADDTVVFEDSDPDRRAAVRAAMARLEPADRELVTLKFVAGLSNAEIAKVLGVSESNAGTRLHRVVVKLREACHA